MPPLVVGAVHRLAQVVLHVAAPEVALGVRVAERREDLADVLVHDVGEDVQAAAVGHADDDLFDAVTGGVVDEQIEHRDHALGALAREALRADEVLVHELLEDLGVREVLEDANELRVVELRAVARRLHRVLEPLACVGLLDVRELDADRSAVRLGEVRDDLAERGAAGEATDADRRELDVVVGLGQPEVRQLELGGGLGRRAERIDLREQMTAHAVRVHELVDAAGERGRRQALVARPVTAMGAAPLTWSMGPGATTGALKACASAPLPLAPPL